MALVATSEKNIEILEKLKSVKVSAHVDGNAIAVSRDDMCNCNLTKGLSEEDAYAMVLLFVKEDYDRSVNPIMWTGKDDNYWFLNVYNS